MDVSKKDFSLSIFADPASVKDIIKGVLHTIFFHRTFTAIRPINRDLLDITLPAIDDPDLETFIDQRATALVRLIDNTHQPFSPPPSSLSTPAPNHSPSNGRGQIAVQFFEKRRRKSYFNFSKADEEICWEQWTVDVTLARPKTESEAEKVRDAMETSLQMAAMKIVELALVEKDHIPPITTSETNPFPYQILLNPKDQGWGKGMGIF